MKINRIRLFALLILGLIVLASVQSRKTKKINNKAKSKKLNRIATKYARMLSENPIDVNAWKRDRFMSHLKNEQKYTKSANKSDKWTLFNYLIGKVLHLLGLPDTDVENYVKTLTKPIALKIVILLMRFQKSMDFTPLIAPMLELKIPGLKSSHFMPLGRQKILNFLNAHIRLRPRW